MKNFVGTPFDNLIKEEKMKRPGRQAAFRHIGARSKSA